MTSRPSLILVHGAATGAWVWDTWRSHLGALGWEVNVLDLRGHGRSLPTDLSTVTMEDYLADLESVTVQIEAAQDLHPVVGGWSMGGILAMMYAAKHNETPAVLLIEPNPPLEVAGRAPPEVVRRYAGGVLTSETFGVFPWNPERSREALFDLTDPEADDFLTRSQGSEESGIAIRQCLRGISVPAGAVNCPALLIYGDLPQRAESAQQSRRLAAHLNAQCLAVSGAGHWGVIYSEALVAQAAPRVDEWLHRVLD